MCECGWKFVWQSSLTRRHSPLIANWNHSKSVFHILQYIYSTIYIYMGKNREKQARDTLRTESTSFINWRWKMHSGTASCQLYSHSHSHSDSDSDSDSATSASWQWQWHANRVYPSAQALSVCDFLSTRQFNRKTHARQLGNASVWMPKGRHCNCSYE